MNPNELKVGDRVRCIAHKFAGLRGTVQWVDGFGWTEVDWDDAESRRLVIFQGFYSDCRFRTLSLEKITVLDEIVMALNGS